MKTLHKAILLIAVLIIFTPSYAQLQKLGNNNVIVVAHRADWRGAPENSLQAIKNSIEMGVGMIEIDLKMTSDGELILMHDKTLDRTTTGEDEPSEYTLEEIKELYLRNGANHKTHHKVPTFREAMLLCKGKVLVNVDKGYDYFEEVYKVLKETGTVDQCIIKSGHSYERVKEENGDVLNKVHYMPVLKLNKENAMEIYQGYKNNYKPYAYEVVFDEYTPQAKAIVDDILASGGKIWVNTLWDDLCAGRHDDRAVELGEIEQSWGWVVDTTKATLIQTDRPEELIEYLRSRKLHP